MRPWKYHCEILRVPEDANTGIIRRTYRLQALERHPDKKGGSIAAKEDFQKLNQAYRYLLSNFKMESPKFQATPPPQPPPKREFAGRGPEPAKPAPFEERRKPAPSERRTQASAPRPEPERRMEPDRRRGSNASVPKLEPHLTQLSLNIPIPPFLGALAWKLRYSRTFHRKARLWATAALALLSLRAAWNYTVFYGDELRTQSCVASESHLKGSSFAFGAVTRASCESRCDIWRAEQSGARKRWGCFWGDEAIP